MNSRSNQLLSLFHESATAFVGALAIVLFISMVEIFVFGSTQPANSLFMFLIHGAVFGTVFGVIFRRWWGSLILLGLASPFLFMMAWGHTANKIPCLLFSVGDDPHVCEFFGGSYLVDHFDQAVLWGIVSAVLASFLVGFLGKIHNKRNVQKD